MEERESAAQMLRRIAGGNSSCALCEELMGLRHCSVSDGDCDACLRKLADMVEAEVEEVSAARCTACIDNLARLGRVPARNRGETLEKWLGRCYLPVPRYTDGEPVGVGSVSEYGTVAMVEVRLTDGGYGNWTLYTEEQEDPVVGTLSERVPRGLLVEGKPVRKDDELWFGREKVTVKDVDGLSDTIFTDYLTEDGEGGWIPYPFESADLSWERPEEPDTMERIRAEAVKPMALYWGCAEWDCCDCKHEPKPKERYGVGSCFVAMQMDIIRRTEEVCKR